MTIKLLVIFALIKLVYFVDFLGSIPDRLVKNSFRLALYTVIVVAAFSGVLISSSAREFNIAGIFGSFLNASEVLGASAKQRGIPRLTKELTAPKITALSVYAYDITNDKILFEVDEHAPLPPASVTKLMTALISLDVYGLEDLIAVPEICTNTHSQEAGLNIGEMIRVRDLVYAMLVGSAGDAACTLSIGKVSYEDFVSRMNSKAKELGMKDTKLTNPVGLDGKNGDHVSTAYDLFLLSRAAISNAFIKEIVKTKEFSTPSGAHVLKNTNDLLWNLSGTVGIKTGRTYAAGEVLSYAYADDVKEIVIVVMGSNDRFTDSKLILDWILKSYSWM